ncbi:hypothetical protein PE067_06700 [Paracoccus sp. DMF-8]|uniref:hypothetical protein n=1 Tax=Paracoccus sp. DMF-8 TaxID=3019445 RepID=UPI0023E812F8|nr:hypothetical protein [Paracoccus sp. DMF-8]MDF3605865.1 hypothetical protein [Paracoccus sp. DMF-8]
MGSGEADLANQRLNDGLAHGKTLIGIEVLEGTGYDDLFYGTVAADTFIGGSGSDVLNGRGGTDTPMVAASGADVLDRGRGARHL